MNTRLINSIKYHLTHYYHNEISDDSFLDLDLVFDLGIVEILEKVLDILEQKPCEYCNGKEKRLGQFWLEKDENRWLLCCDTKKQAGPDYPQSVTIVFITDAQNCFHCGKSLEGEEE